MVNTFLPYSNFDKIAKVLDNKRLGKQRVEAYQIINILTNATDKQGWRNHVIVHMWRGHTNALKLYYNTIVKEWIRRGFVNNMKLYPLPKNIEMPWFVKNINVNLSHQASLIRKDTFYQDKFKVPTIFLKYKYIWPSKLNKDQIEYLKNHPKTLINIAEFAEKVEV